MSNATIVLDVVIASVAAILLVIIAPGLAVVGLVAVLVLAVCGLSLLFDALRLRSRRRSPSPRLPGRARPPGARGWR